MLKQKRGKDDPALFRPPTPWLQSFGGWEAEGGEHRKRNRPCRRVLISLLFSTHFFYNELITRTSRSRASFATAASSFLSPTILRKTAGSWAETTVSLGPDS
jgi:hypothetical protein